MNFRTENGKTIKQAFDEFHKANPHVYQKFKKLALGLINQRNARSKISSKMIINQIRWLTYTETTEQTGYKINDAYTSHYARLFISDYPQYETKLETRNLRSE